MLIYHWLRRKISPLLRVYAENIAAIVGRHNQTTEQSEIEAREVEEAFTNAFTRLRVAD